jgi:hypothetical protein
VPARRKRVSETVMARVSAAVDSIAADHTAPRTKRQIEQISSLGHDAVARAFRQDADDQGVPHRLNERLNELMGTTGRRSPAEEERRQHKQEVLELNQEVRDLNRQLDRYAMCLLAQLLRDLPQDDGIASDVVAIRDRRGRHW